MRFTILAAVAATSVLAATPGQACDPATNPFGCVGFPDTVQPAVMQNRLPQIGTDGTASNEMPEGVKTIRVTPRVQTVRQRMQTLQTLAAGPTGPILAPGEQLPDGAMVVLNTGYRGLPPAQDGWWYFEADGEVYRAHRQTREVIERVTHKVKRRF